MPHSPHATSRAGRLLFAALAVTLLLAGCRQNPGAGIAAAGGPPPGGVAAAAHPPAPAADAVERGRYLVVVGGCNDCHTPWVPGPEGHPAPDMTRMLSGHPEDLVMPAPPAAVGPWIWSGAGSNTAFAGPWGVSFASNLTPDASGLGAWDEETFVRGLRTGKHWGQSRPILPPMPWPNMAQMTDADLGAVFAYLRSVPPIANHVPEPLPPAAATVPAG